MPPSKRRARLGMPDVFPLVSEEHAAAIGYVAIRWSAVEEAVGYLIVVLLNIEMVPAHAIIAANPALAVLNMVTVLVNLSGDEEVIGAWQNLVQRHEELRPRRNDAIHAQWQVSGDAHSAFRTKGRGELRLILKQVETGTLDALADDILILAEDIGKFGTTLMLRGISKMVLSTHPPGLRVDQYLVPTPTTVRPPPTPRPRKLSSAQKRRATREEQSS